MNITKEELEILLKECNTISEILRRLNLNTHTSIRKTFKTLIKKYNIDDTEFILKSKNFIKNNIKKSKNLKYENEVIFIENSSYIGGSSIKKRLFESNLLKEQCCLCGQLPIHNNIPLTLQLDHINGIHNDNRLENLRILCPNCHTQTHTWGTRNIKKKYFCDDCGIEMEGYSNVCKVCCKKYNIAFQKKFEVSKEELEKLITEMSFVDIGKKFNVTPNTIRKRCKMLKIKIPKYPKGYWIKKSPIYKLTVEQIKSELELYAATIVCKKYNCGYKEFKKYCKNLNIILKTLNNKNITLEEIENVKKLKNEGISNRKIVKLLNMTKNRVDRIVNNYINDSQMHQ